MLKHFNLKNGFGNSILKLFRGFKKPRMIWGYYTKSGQYLALTRLSDNIFIDFPERLVLGNNVFIGHFNFIDASNGVTIEEGCQITNFISITSHSSHISLRLYGKNYTNEKNPTGYIKGPVHIGKYTFIGPHSVIMPNTSIGKGTLVSAYSYVEGNFPDFSIIKGNPAKVVGDTRNLDSDYLKENPELEKFYLEWVKS